MTTRSMNTQKSYSLERNFLIFSRRRACRVYKTREHSMWMLQIRNWSEKEGRKETRRPRFVKNFDLLSYLKIQLDCITI